MIWRSDGHTRTHTHWISHQPTSKQIFTDVQRFDDVVNLKWEIQYYMFYVDTTLILTRRPQIRHRKHDSLKKTQASANKITMDARKREMERARFINFHLIYSLYDYIFYNALFYASFVIFALFLYTYESWVSEWVCVCVLFLSIYLLCLFPSRCVFFNSFAISYATCECLHDTVFVCLCVCVLCLLYSRPKIFCIMFVVVVIPRYRSVLLFHWRIFS